MARLTTRQRDKLKKSDFALPSRIRIGARGAKDTRDAYPIEDKAHARSALSRASHDESRRNYLRVARAVHKKYPKIVIKALGEKRQRKKKR